MTRPEITPTTTATVKVIGADPVFTGETNGGAGGGREDMLLSVLRCACWRDHSDARPTDTRCNAAARTWSWNDRASRPMCMIAQRA